MTSLLFDVSELPLRPGTATQILALVEDPDASAADIGALVRLEPSITARLLALANSPMFNRGHAVADVDRAIVVVGLNSVRGIALGAAVDSFFEDHDDLDDDHWEDATAAAACAIAVGARLGVDGGQAFCAGLMHDVGQLGMGIAHPEVWARVVEQSGDGTAERLLLEEELFGGTHAVAGADFLERLGLPGAVSAAVRTHHHDASEIDSPFGIALAVAANYAGVRDEDDEVIKSVLDAYLPQFAETNEDLLVEIRSQLSSLTLVFSR